MKGRRVSSKKLYREAKRAEKAADKARTRKPRPLGSPEQRVEYYTKLGRIPRTERWQGFALEMARLAPSAFEAFANGRLSDEDREVLARTVPRISVEDFAKARREELTVN